MSIPRSNVDFAKRIFADRVGDDYVYGGALDPDDTSVGTDCSGLVGSILEALVHGTAMSWARHVTTESWPYNYATNTPAPEGTIGPYGTISVGGRHLDRIPPDAAAIVAVMHGGGGEYSHTEIMVDGQIMESGGAHDDVGSEPQTPIDHPEWTDYWYLPGPISSAPSVMTVPLTQKANGMWTSPSPAWAHLIMRESGGNPTIIQQIIDVNSGGNEAEGLFQITPATWRAHNGTDFAATPRLATPQQQALVAARIFTRNPSGSDWGAGLAGRENANELAAGLVPTTVTQEDDFMSALTDAEQREMLDLLRQQSAYRRVSRSPLRHVGEGPTETATGFELNVDGSVHTLLVQSLARLGDPDALALLNEVANLDPNRYPDRAHDRQLAAAILNDIAGQATASTAPASGQTPGVIPAPPAAIPTPIPAAIPPQPALPPAPAVVPPVTAEGGLLGEIVALTNKLHDVSQQVTAIVEG